MKSKSRCRILTQTGLEIIEALKGGKDLLGQNGVLTPLIKSLLEAAPEGQNAGMLKFGAAFQQPYFLESALSHTLLQLSALQCLLLLALTENQVTAFSIVTKAVKLLSFVKCQDLTSARAYWSSSAIPCSMPCKISCLFN